MYKARDEGMGLSIVVYATIMAAALAAIVMPVLWLSGPTEYRNAELPKYDITSSRPLSDQHRKIPLARLQRDDIVDAKMLAAAAAPATPSKQDRIREARERPSRTARTAYAQAPDQDDNRPRRSFFGFSLF